MNQKSREQLAHDIWELTYFITPLKHPGELHRIRRNFGLDEAPEELRRAHKRAHGGIHRYTWRGKEFWILYPIEDLDVQRFYGLTDRELEELETEILLRRL